MKIGVLLLVGVFLNSPFHSAFAMGPKTDLEMQGLRGPVQAVVEVVEGTFIWTSHYDGQGRLTEFIVSYVDKTMFPGKEEKHVYEYDSEGKRIKAMGYAEDRKVFERETYSYDDHGNRTAEIIISANGALKSASFYAYDEKGNRSSFIKYITHKLLHSTSFVHDQLGRVIREVHYDNGVLDADCKQTYSEDAKRKDSLCYKPNGALLSKGVERFDDSGNVIERVNYDPAGMPVSKTTYAYQFDATDNWIKRTFQVWHGQDGQFVLKETRTQERKITYHSEGKH